jgi:cell division protein FtsW
MTRDAVVLFSVVMALVLVGIVAVYSASTVTASSVVQFEGGNEFGYLWRQLVFVGIGMAGLIAGLRFDYHKFRRPLYYRGVALVSFALLILVLVPGVGTEVNGARRWIRIMGFGFQPSEFAKMALVILLAVKLSANQDDIKSFFRGFVPALGITGVFAALVFLEKDLGVPAVMLAVAFLMILMAGTRWIYVVFSMLLAASGVAAIAITTPYRLKRLVAFLDPWQYAQDEGFQLIQSMAAFARGSLLGQGPGASEQKLFYLPFPHTDFIFAVWGEEMGLVGTLLVVALFAVFLVVALRLALCAPDLFGTVLAAGIAALISVQAAFNMGVATGLLPTKGLPLPFISHGGTALIVNMTLVGILLNVGLQAQEPEEGRKPALAR